MGQEHSINTQTNRAVLKDIFIALSLFLLVMFASKVGGILDDVLYRNYYGFYGSEFSIICVLAVAFAFSYWFRPYFKGILGVTGLGYGLLLVLVLLPYALALISHSKTLYIEPEEVVLLVKIAVVEELATRGLLCAFLMKHAKTEKQVLWIIVLSGIFFGLCHFGNISAGQSVIETIRQVISTTGSGILMAAIFLKSGNIWPTIIMHFVHNYLCQLCTGQSVDTISKTGGEFSAISFIFTLMFAFLYFLIAIALVSESSRKEILELWKDKWSGNEKRVFLKPLICSVLAVFVFSVAMFGLNTVTQRLFINLMGYNGYYSDEEVSENYIIRTYYAGAMTFKDGSPIAVACGFKDELKEYVVDIDGDGEQELVCNCQLENSAEAGTTIVYKKINGVINVGTIPSSAIAGIEDNSDTKVSEQYIPEINYIYVACIAPSGTRDNALYKMSHIEYIPFTVLGGID